VKIEQSTCVTFLPFRSGFVAECRALIDAAGFPEPRELSFYRCETEAAKVRGRAQLESGGMTEHGDYRDVASCTMILLRAR
jgi:hypothetical protein